MKHTGKYSIDMTEGTIWKQLLRFAIPLIIGELLQQSYSVADSVIVGRFIGKEALAAVACTESISNTFIGMFTGISTGCTILAARYFGAKDKEELQATVHTAVTLTIVLGGVLTVLGYLLTPGMLHLLATPEDVYPDAVTYLHIYMLGVYGLVLYNIGGGLLRAVGDSRRPLYALILSCGINICLDIVLVIFFHMGVAGAAIATFVAQFISAFYLLYLLCTTKEMHRLNLRKLQLRKDIVKTIMDLGLPIGIQKSLVSLSNTLVISHVNYFGSGASASWGVYRKLDHFITKNSQNLSTAVTTFVSQNTGAKKSERVQQGFRLGVIMVIIITMSLGIIMSILHTPLIHMFNKDEEVLYYGSRIICMLMPIQWLSGIVQVEAGYLRGRGNSKGPMMIMMLSYIVIRQVYLNTVWVGFKSIFIVASCYPVAWLSAAIIMEVYRRVWTKKKDQQAA